MVVLPGASEELVKLANRLIGAAPATMAANIFERVAMYAEPPPL